MSVLVVGLSHKSAPVAILEQAVVSGDALAKLLRDVAQTDPVAETFVVSTCNRVEVYAEVDQFHAGVSAICELLARHCRRPAQRPHPAPVRALRGPGGAAPARGGLRPGLDGGRREPDPRPGALRRSSSPRSRAPSAGCWATSARSRCGRASGPTTETGIDRAGASLVSVGIELAAARLGDAAPRSRDARRWPGGSVLVVGAGSMSSLAATTAGRIGAASIVVANRTRRHAERLAATVGRRGRPRSPTWPPPWPPPTWSSPAPARTAGDHQRTWSAAALRRRSTDRESTGARGPLVAARPGHAARRGTGRGRPARRGA